MYAATSAVSAYPVPRVRAMPAALPRDGTVRIELEEGVAVLRTTDMVQTRIETLIAKERETGLTSQEKEELDYYEDIDDYLSFVNRVIRNLSLQPQSRVEK